MTSKYPANGLPETFNIALCCVSIVLLSAAAKSWTSVVRKIFSLLALLLCIGPLVQATKIIGYLEALDGPSPVAFRASIPSLIPGHPASDCTIIGILLMAAPIWGVQEHDATRSEKLGFALVIVALSTYLLATMSRGVYLSLGVYILYGARQMANKGRFTPIAIIASCAALAWLLGIPVQHVFHISGGGALDRSIGARMESMRVALNIVKAHPELGVGPGNAVFSFVGTSSANGGRPLVGRIYNLYVDLAASSGLLVLIPIACVLLHIVWRLRKNVLRKEQSADRWVPAVALLAAAVHEATASTLFLTPYASILAAWLIAHTLTAEVDANNLRDIQSSCGVKWLDLVVMGSLLSVVLPLSIRTGAHYRSHALIERAIAQMEGQNYSEANRILVSAIRLQPTNAYAHELYALTLVSDDPRYAISENSSWFEDLPKPVNPNVQNEIERAIELNQYDPGLYINLAWIQLRNGAGDRGISNLRTAEALDPNDPVVHMSLYHFMRKKDKAGAIDELIAAIVAAPRVLRSQFYKDIASTCDCASSVQAAALKKLTMDLSNTRSPIIRAKLAAFDLYTGDSEAAMINAEATISEVPNIAGAWLVKGHIAEDAGDLFEAQKAYSLALWSDQESGEALSGLCHIELLTHQAPTQCRYVGVRGHYQYHIPVAVGHLYQQNPVLQNDIIVREFLPYCCFPAPSKIGGAA